MFSQYAGTDTAVTTLVDKVLVLTLIPTWATRGRSGDVAMEDVTGLAFEDHSAVSSTAGSGRNDLFAAARLRRQQARRMKYHNSM